MPFVQGKSGNPAGRPTRTVEEKAAFDRLRKYTKKLSKTALEKLQSDFIENPRCRPDLKIKAIDIVLKFAFANQPIIKIDDMEQDSELTIRIVKTQPEEELLNDE